MRKTKDITKQQNKEPIMFFEKEVMWQILHMYVEGMAINDISNWTGLSPREVNLVIDSVSPHL